MNGWVIQNTPIAVDLWRIRQCPSAKVFFLTHLHGDHIVGLSSSWQYQIYCSEVTGTLLKEKYEIAPSLVTCMETGRSHIVYLDQDEKEQMTVTPLDANHCPGAVMFLFEGYFGKILYTGDFRWSDQMEADLFCCNIDHLDVLYLDNTYCSPGCEFPSRDVSTEEIISIIKSHPEHDVLIGMRTLGKEDLLLHIANEFGEWISLPGDLYYNAKILELPNVFCVNETNCRIRVEPFYSISNKNMEKWNERRPTIAILPTALYTGLDMSPFVNRDDVFIVPYSDHSCYSELLKFVKFVQPKVIYPIVSADTKGPFGVKITDRADMSCFKQYLSKEQRLSVVIPDSVKQWMSLGQRRTPKALKIRKRKRKSVQLKQKNSAKGVVYDSDSSESEQDTDENNILAKSKGKKLVVKLQIVPPNSNCKERGKDGQDNFEVVSQIEENIDVEINESSESSSPSILVSSFSNKIDSPDVSCPKIISSDEEESVLTMNNIVKKQLFPIFKPQKRINVKTVKRMSPYKKLMFKDGNSHIRTKRNNTHVIPVNTSYAVSIKERKKPSVKALSTSIRLTDSQMDKNAQESTVQNEDSNIRTKPQVMRVHSLSTNDTTCQNGESNHNPKQICVHVLEANVISLTPKKQSKL